jgi:hypothetical protein
LLLAVFTQSEATTGNHSANRLKEEDRFSCLRFEFAGGLFPCQRPCAFHFRRRRAVPEFMIIRVEAFFAAIQI